MNDFCLALHTGGSPTLLYPFNVLRFLFYRDCTSEERLIGLDLLRRMFRAEYFSEDPNKRGSLVPIDPMNAIPEGWNPDSELKELTYWDFLSPRQRFSVYAATAFLDRVRKTTHETR